MIKRALEWIGRVLREVTVGGEKPPEDIAPLDFGDLNWDEAHRRASIDTLYEATVKNACDSIEWYGRNKPFKKRWAQRIRVTAILAAALTTVIPIVTPITIEGVEFKPVLASVVAALGVLALSLDQFFGFSAAWTRFLLAKDQLEGRLHTFRYDWEADKVTWVDETTLSDEKTQELIRRCAAFAAEIHTLVTEETRLWVEEFKSTLKGLEDSLRVEAQARRSGAVNVTVMDHDALDGIWQLYLDHRHVGDFTGASGTAKDLPPGQYVMRIVAQRSGEQVEAASTIEIRGGEITDIQVTLA